MAGMVTAIEIGPSWQKPASACGDEVNQDLTDWGREE